MANHEQEKIFATPVANKELGSRFIERMPVNQYEQDKYLKKKAKDSNQLLRKKGGNTDG